MDNSSVCPNSICVNCCYEFQTESQTKAKQLSFTLSRESPGLGDELNETEIQIVDAIFYIFGLSSNDLYSEDSNESGFGGIALCSDCTPLLKQLFDSFHDFKNVSQKDSLLWNSVKWNRNKVSVKSEIPLQDFENSNIQCFDSDNTDAVNIKSEFISQDYQVSPQMFISGDSPGYHMNDFSCSANDCATGGEQDSLGLDGTGEANDNVHIKEETQSCHVEQGIPTFDMNLFIPSCHIGERLDDGDGARKSNRRKYPPPKNPFHNPKSKEKPKCFRCDLCDEYFRSDYLLKKHECSHRKPYRCSVCRLTFQTSIGLQEHEIVHNGEKPYTCTVCGMGFTKVLVLKQHQRTHNPGTKHKCRFCGKRLLKSRLQFHENSHTSKQPYRCSFCVKRFTDSRHLQEHEKFHIEGKPFKCSVCGKGFVNTGMLRKHERTHTGEKLHTVEFCEKGSGDSCRLRRHCETRHTTGETLLSVTTEEETGAVNDQLIQT